MKDAAPAVQPSHRQAMRLRMLQHRGKLGAVERAEANLSIQKLVLARILPEWKTILMYVNLPDEVATISLLLELIENGKKICVPVFDRATNRYDISEVRNFETDLESGWFGILEPRREARRPVAPADLDAIFLPGLAFDRAGNRLGFGYGYFDRLCEGTRAIKIGLAYPFQIVDRVEARTRDVPVHMIITKDEAIECRKP